MNDRPNRDTDEGPDTSADSENAKIHAEEVKDRHTTHWDRDYLSKEELDAAYREGQQKEPESGAENEDSDREG